ncbi:MFS transporter [Plantibacter sp. YIM 135347]|uniref:MFS transporter n=1 Tax=Plantibacter sp. YIM 135347 TaxID=3423919 RepID=UPI003D34753D
MPTEHSLAAGDRTSSSRPSPSSSSSPSPSPSSPSPRLRRSPVPTALLLSAVGFITLLTEVLPAGVLPAMARDLGVSESLAGQSVAVFALGCIAAAIPLTRATARLDRRTLVLLAITVSMLANLGTALAPEIWTHLLTRFVAGLVAGLVWAMLPGYTRGFTDPGRFGSTLGIVLSGATLGFAVGVPLGTILSDHIGWRGVYAAISAGTLLLGLVALLIAPRVAGVRASNGSGIRTALAKRSVLVVLAAVAASVSAQNVAYTYLAPVLTGRSPAVALSVVLGAFGVASVVGTLGAGRLANRRLGASVITALAIGATGLTAASFAAAPWLLVLAAAAWGLAFGAYSVLFQVAVARVGGAAADAAQSALVTVWNCAIALGGAAGGIILASWGPTLLLPTAAALTVIAIPLAVSIASSIRAHGPVSLER